MLPQKGEREFIGTCIFQDGKIIKDQVCERVEWLISNHLIKIASDDTGWEVLYQDPEDKRYWELSYPSSELHGGGAPSLVNLTLEEAREKYNLTV